MLSFDLFEVERVDFAALVELCVGPGFRGGREQARVSRPAAPPVATAKTTLNVVIDPA